jgi:hypothetical protein
MKNFIRTAGVPSETRTDQALHKRLQHYLCPSLFLKTASVAVVVVIMSGYCYYHSRDCENHAMELFC